jgi:hypothetical protein
LFLLLFRVFFNLKKKAVDNSLAFDSDNEFDFLSQNGLADGREIREEKKKKQAGVGLGFERESGVL